MITFTSMSDSIQIGVANSGGFILVVKKREEGSVNKFSETVHICETFSSVIETVQKELPNLRTSDGKPCCGG